MNRVRNIVGLLILSSLKFKFDADGHVDVFGVLAKEIDLNSADELSTVGSARFKTDVTADQVRKKDYSGVSWERYRKFDGQPQRNRSQSARTCR